jgi:hypothetical protein
MLAGSGETITILEAVIHTTFTVCSLLLHQAAVRVTVIVEYRLKFQLPNIEFQFTVFMLVQLSNLSCLLSTAVFTAFCDG